MSFALLRQALRILPFGRYGPNAVASVMDRASTHASISTCAGFSGKVTPHNALTACGNVSPEKKGFPSAFLKLKDGVFQYRFSMEIWPYACVSYEAYSVSGSLPQLFTSSTRTVGQGWTDTSTKSRCARTGHPSLSTAISSWRTAGRFRADNALAIPSSNQWPLWRVRSFCRLSEFCG